MEAILRFTESNYSQAQQGLRLKCLHISSVYVYELLYLLTKNTYEIASYWPLGRALDFGG